MRAALGWVAQTGGGAYLEVEAAKLVRAEAAHPLLLGVPVAHANPRVELLRRGLTPPLPEPARERLALRGFRV